MNSFKSKLIDFLQGNSLLKFLTNCFLFLRSLWRADLLSAMHLKDLHDMWLKVEKHDRNLMLIPHFFYKVHATPTAKAFYEAREYKISSQNGEDGLLLYIYSQIGTANRFFVEFGAGGATSNTRNLSTQFGWNGMSFDGDETSIKGMRELYRMICAEDTSRILRAETVWLSKDTVKHHLQKYSIPADFDLLSIDIDGIDYWLWRALSEFRPRVVVVEYNASLGPDTKLVIPYEKDFFRWSSKCHPAGWYYGASLSAWVELAKSKGYELIACESTGVNAFFVRSDLLVPGLPTQTAVEAFYPDARRAAIATQQQQIEELRQFPWVDVPSVRTA